MDLKDLREEVKRSIVESRQSIMEELTAVMAKMLGTRVKDINSVEKESVGDGENNNLGSKDPMGIMGRGHYYQS